MQNKAMSVLLRGMFAMLVVLPMQAQALSVKKNGSAVSLAKGIASSYQGSTGLIHTISPIILPKTTFTLLTHLRYWQQDSFLANDLFVRRLDTGGAFSISFNDYWEFFFAGMSGSHFIENDILATSSLIQSIGDFKTGFKAAYRVTPLFYLGADLYMWVPAKRGSIGPDFTATSVGGDLLVGLDWTGLSSPTPLRLTTNLGYRRDNSDQLLPDGAVGNPATNYGLGIPPDDDVWIWRFAVEVPQNFLNLFLEYSTEQYWDVNGSNKIQLPTGEERELKRSYIENPQRLTPGIRLFPTRGLNIDLAVELGSPLFFADAMYDVYQLGTLEEIMPDWVAHFGIGYTFLPPEPVAPREGRVVGLVLDKETKKPIEGALLEFPGKKLSTLVTNKLGEYRSYTFEEGPIKIKAFKDGYRNQITSVVVSQGEELRRDFYLKQNHKEGTLMVVIVDNQGHPVSTATLEFQAKGMDSLRPDAKSGLVETRMEPGVFTLVAKAPGYQPKSIRVRVVNKKTTKVTLSLTPEEKVGKISGRIENVQGDVIVAVVSFDRGAPNLASDPNTGQYATTVGIGQYVVKASANGYLTQAKKVIVEQDRLTTVNFVLEEEKKSGKIKGAVVDSKNGKGVFAVVSFPNGEKGNVATDPETGKFIIELPAGSFLIKAASPSYRAAEQTVDVRAGEEVDVLFSLKGFSKVKVTTEKIEITEMIQFRPGKSIIKINSYPTLDEVAMVLQSNPEFRLVVEGHTDSVGSSKVNRSLSQKRAGAVRDYLIARGITKDRLQAVGYGEDQPIADNATSEGRAANRRVEFRIVKKD